LTAREATGVSSMDLVGAFQQYLFQYQCRLV